MFSNNVHGDIATKATFTYKPILVLPPARRGGRRGKLTAKQTKEQRNAKLRGICVRCRKTRIKCIGGIPCIACLKNSNPKIWRTPCVKAHFLGIIEAGSIFQRSSLYQHWILNDEDPMSVLQQIALMRHLQYQQTALKGQISIHPLEFELTWDIGVLGLHEAYLKDGDGQYRRPNITQIANAEKRLVKLDPTGGLLFFGIRPDHPEKYLWASVTCIFCSMREFVYDFEDGVTSSPFPDILPNSRFQEILDKSINSLIWFCSRYAEICLFRYLQTAANNPSNVTADQKTFIYCLLSVLIASESNPPNFSALQIEEGDARMAFAYQTLLDRQNRVRMALWVYASITIDKLQPWTDFWNSLPLRLHEYSTKNLPSLFHESLKKFEEGLHDLKTASIMDMQDFLRLLSFSFVKQAQGQESYLEPREQQEEFLDKIREVFQTSMENPGTYIVEIAEWQRKFTEDTWSPMNEGDHREVSSRVFSALIFTASTGVHIQQTYHFLRMFYKHLGQKQAYEKVKNMISEKGRTEEEFWSTHPSPSSSSFLIAHLDSSCLEEDLFARYIYLHHRSGRRWTELVALLGEAILLAGQDHRLSQSPLLELNIPLIVGLGSDEEFHRLTEILSVECTWLRDVCTKLNRIVETIQLQVDQNNINSLGGYMKKIAMETFGEQCSHDPTLNPYVYGLSKTDLAFLYICKLLPRASTVKMGSTLTLEILLESVWLSMMKLVLKEIKYDDQSYLDSAIVRALGEAVTRFLVKYRSTLTEDRARIRIELNIMDTRTSKAMKEFIRMFTRAFSRGQERICGGHRHLSLEPLPTDVARAQEAFQDIFI